MLCAAYILVYVLEDTCIVCISMYAPLRRLFHCAGPHLSFYGTKLPCTDRNHSRMWYYYYCYDRLPMHPNPSPNPNPILTDWCRMMESHTCWFGLGAARYIINGTLLVANYFALPGKVQ